MLCIVTPRTMLLAAAIALSALAISCSGGGSKGTKTATSVPTLGPVTPLGTASPALQQYFQKVQALDSTATQRLVAINSMLETPVSADQQFKVLGDYLTELIAIDKDLASGLQQLTPPPEAKNAQEGAVDGLNRVISLARDASTAGPNVTDVIAVISSPDAKDANNRLSRACAILNRVAEAYGLSSTLDCGQ